MRPRFPAARNAFKNQISSLVKSMVMDMHTGKPIDVFSPMRFTSRLTVSVVNGVPRSFVNKVAPAPAARQSLAS
jgi:hypothetical protein